MQYTDNYFHLQQIDGIDVIDIFKTIIDKKMKNTDIKYKFDIIYDEDELYKVNGGNNDFSPYEFFEKTLDKIVQKENNEEDLLLDKEEKITSIQKEVIVNIRMNVDDGLKYLELRKLKQ
jgi:hypothetical protein